MALYVSNENEAVLLFSRLLIVAGRVTVGSCKQMATKRPDWAKNFRLVRALTAAALGNSKCEIKVRIRVSCW